MKRLDDIKVSVLVPTFQRRDLVLRAVSRALQQTHKNLEVVVYDDGSTDGTDAAIKGLGDKRIVYRRGQNRGEPFARNELLSMASGEYSVWLDSDDVSNVWRVETQLYAMLGTCAKWVCSGTDVLGKPDTRWSCPPRMSWTMHHSMPSVMFETRSAKKYDTRYLVSSCDMRWELEMTDSHGPPVYLPLQLYYLDRSPPDRMSDQDHNPKIAHEYAKNKERLACERVEFYRRWVASGKSPKPVLAPIEIALASLSRAYEGIRNTEIGFTSVDKAWRLAGGN